MSDFPRGSAFSAPIDLTKVREMFDRTEAAVAVHETKQPAGTTVSYKALERWYMRLNDISIESDIDDETLLEGINEVKDDIYSYLKG